VHKLTEQGMVAYAPFVKKMQQWSDRKKMVEFPMLSGYVFVNIDETEKENVLKCPGVFSFINLMGLRLKLRDVEIAILKSIEESGYDVTHELADFKIIG
jgi:transcriptional antiterminator RfaH